VGAAHASPTAGDGEKDLGEVGKEELLLFGSEHEVAVVLGLRGESGEDAAADAEVGVAHVGAFFGARKGEGESAKVVGGHDCGSRNKSARSEDLEKILNQLLPRHFEVVRNVTQYLRNGPNLQRGVRRDSDVVFATHLI
jgi:hypothetical protein